MDIAESSLFLSMARILWTFRISRAKDESGHDITPDPNDITGGLAAYPRPFSASIIPRSAQREGVVRSEWQAAKASLDSAEQWKKAPGSS